LQQRPVTQNSDIATKTGDIDISGTMTNSVEISTANSGFLTMMSSIKVQPNDGDNDGQPEVAAILSFPVVGRCCNRLGVQFRRARYGRKALQICRLNFDALCSFGDISISGSAATLLFPVVHQCRIYLRTLPLSFPLSKMLLLPL